MPCDLRIRLERDHADAGAAFDDARERLRSRIGISQKEEYEDLNRRADEAWTSLNEIREQLHSHIQEHGCEAAIEAAGSH